MRTPLTPIRGYLEMLVKGLSAAPETGRMAGYARSAFDQSRRLQVLVNDLLDVTRLQSGKLKLVREPVDLAAVVTQAVENMQVGVGEQGDDAQGAGEALVEVKGADEPLMVDGDATRLEKIVMNLLTNAAKYAPASPIDVSLRRVDGEAELQVQDYGRGIAPEALPHIFSRFYQVERHESGSPGGLGLGLYITRELVQAHGGRIDVQSAPGAGATFTVRLPLLTT